ncbi:SDR family NAD(P)-dependent oxidoreductase [Anaerosphaera multitolerans]|uniref:SDR family oxidoreductase n=1 Tax=Anaerosphaera multitolerans TaxID=2487351 RepID=A0A437S5M7_9FIRM|nr:SDR family oxidoreductase [Anaerosphaera multitolerans]RVU54321.1 SDR family oxidoreductase [Anaerosphaera multitolerans]
MKLLNKVIIVTGATSGIGSASAKLFASEGAKIIATGRNIKRGETLIEYIKSQGGEATFVQADMAVDSDMDKVVDKAIKKYGRIDALFNNAGISISRTLEDFDEESWDKLLDTNLKAPFKLVQKVMPHLVKTKGNILNTGSVAAFKPTPASYGYGPSKSGLINLTKVAAYNYASKGVRVNALCPGMTLTPILESVPKENLEKLQSTIPMGRLGKPEEMAKTALFLISDDASYITGQAIIVDGGFTL